MNPRPIAIAALLAASLTVTATAAASVAHASSEPSAELESTLESLAAAATEEGKLTVYSSQSPTQLEALSAAFRAAYPGIDVAVVRQTPTELQARLEVELATGAEGADLVVLAQQVWMSELAANGDFVAATDSPRIAGLGEYDAERYAPDGILFEVGAGVLTYAWNTDEVPDGLTDYTDLLAPELAGGRIGIVDAAASTAVVDYYLWLEAGYGTEYIDQLADQAPRIYTDALQLGEAISSGEVFAGVFTAPVQLVPARDNGAPVDVGFAPSGTFGARYFGGIPRSARNPAAAALFADFMLTREGQEAVQGQSGSSILPGIDGAVLTNEELRIVEPASAEAAAAYVERFEDLFR